jgi:acetyl-CoA carboxylase carboxyl transferase subunit alpha
MKHQLDFEKPIIELQRKLDELEKHAENHSMDIRCGEEIAAMKVKIAEMRRQIFANLGAWDRVKIARHPKRPFMLDYVALAFADFAELHGDRLYADDHAVVGGLARLDGHKVMVIGTQKGRDTKENIRRNFGSAMPEGYRKALRLMQLAEKFSLPVISLVDTPGAFPGIGAEERHIGEAIAVNLREMMMLDTPMIAAVIGEGGSGGALGIGVADRVLILENAYYSVISPEGCAAILWKERSAAAKAAEALKISAKDLLSLGLVDEIVPESPGGAHNDPAETAAALKASLLRNLEDLEKLTGPDRLKQRYDKFRAHGRFTEKIETPAMNGAASKAALITAATGAAKGKTPSLPSSALSFAPGNAVAAVATIQL